MSSETYYSLTWKPHNGFEPDSDFDNLTEQIVDVINNKNFEDGWFHPFSTFEGIFEETDNGYSGYDAYWYLAYEKELIFLSKEIKNVLFCLHYFSVEHEGEFGDIYFLNGKMQDCSAICTIPEFDENKLVEYEKKS